MVVEGIVIVLGIILLTVICVGVTAGRCCPECPCDGIDCRCKESCGCYTCEQVKN